MAVRKIKENIFAVGVNHWDRKIFDELIPLPDGTSYNSYLIFGSEKTVLIDAVDTATIVFAIPTVLAGPHPLGAYATIFINAIKPKAKFTTAITSYGWGGQIISWVKNHLGNFKGEFLETLEIKGLPNEEDLKKVDNLAEIIVDKHKSLGII